MIPAIHRSSIIQMKQNTTATPRPLEGIWKYSKVTVGDIYIIITAA